MADIVSKIVANAAGAGAGSGEAAGADTGLVLPEANGADGGLKNAIGVLNNIKKKFQDLEIKTNREAAKADSKGADDVLSALGGA
jgi:hypothetical protein